MKRIIAIVTIMSIISLMLATVVFAADNANVPKWFKDMISARKTQVDQAEKDGSITQDQAKLYKDNIDQMEKFHTENGFPNGMMSGGFGGCGGGRFNNSNNSNNTGFGFGRGMMGGGSGYNMMNGFNYAVQ